VKRVIVSFALAVSTFAQPAAWIVQESGTTASLRGVSAVSDKIVWASGSNGTFLRTLDGGTHWNASKVTGAADLDFRAVRAFDEKTAYLLSIGAGEKSRVYKTTDGGERWLPLYTNPDPKGFWDALAFWDSDHGIILGDPVEGHFTVLTTNDAGASWHAQKTPAAVPNEGAFAASNSCLFVRGAREVWFGTGGPGGARVFHSTDAGQTWTVSKTPIRNDGASAGIFALEFYNNLRGIAVGGDYNKFKETTGLVAVTNDGGKTWRAPKGTPHGFRSDIKFVYGVWITTGTSGSDYSNDFGDSWTQFDSGNFNAIGATNSNASWVVGPKGSIGSPKEFAITVR
jgi:photosystem II stability/assembly factor-like uncharacterized protein